METLRDRIRTKLQDDSKRIDWLGLEAINRAAYWTFHLRKRAGLSQAQLANRLGTRQPNISAIEAGETNVTIKSLGRIAAALGADVVEMFAPVGRPCGIGEGNYLAIDHWDPKVAAVGTLYLELGDAGTVATIPSHTPRYMVSSALVPSDTEQEAQAESFGIETPSSRQVAVGGA